jgi:hypothetical protein
MQDRVSAWVMGVFVGVLGLVGLVLAAGAHDVPIYGFGLGVFVFAMIAEAPSRAAPARRRSCSPGSCAAAPAARPRAMESSRPGEMVEADRDIARRQHARGRLAWRMRRSAGRAGPPPGWPSGGASSRAHARSRRPRRGRRPLGREAGGGLDIARDPLAGQAVDQVHVDMRDAGARSFATAAARPRGGWTRPISSCTAASTSCTPRLARVRPAARAAISGVVEVRGSSSAAISRPARKGTGAQLAHHGARDPSAPSAVGVPPPRCSCGTASAGQRPRDHRASRSEPRAVARDARGGSRDRGVAAAIPAERMAEGDMDVERERVPRAGLGEPSGIVLGPGARNAARWDSWCSAAGLGAQTRLGEFPGLLEDGIGDGGEMAVDALEVAHDVEMDRAGLDGLGPALAQAREVAVGRL